MEPIDDLPLLREQLDQLGLSQLLNAYFPDHGHWGGISGGKMAVGWLLYILSEGDHRLSHVEEWAASRLACLSALLGEAALRSKDFSDDRLGRYLDKLGQDDQWACFEQALGQKMIQVYDLAEGCPTIIRTDSFNAPQYRDSGQWCRHGYSKQRRSDQPFYKVMTSVCGPWAVPVAVDIVKGSGPDADHYMPIIKRVQQMFAQCGQLYVGDSQLGSMFNRASIHRAGDFYLSPLSRKQVSEQQLMTYLESVPEDYRTLPSIFTDDTDSRAAAYFYECSASLDYSFDDQPGSDITWEERRILVYSPKYAQGLCESFKNRIAEAEEKIQNLVIYKRGRKRLKSLAELHACIGAVIKKYKVEDCFTIECWEEVLEKKVQRYKDRAAEIRKEVKLYLKLSRNEQYISDRTRKLGWQVYGTNLQADQMGSAELVRCYRDEYKIEHLFDYAINRDIGLLPLYLKKESRVRALIRLLMIAMRIYMLIQKTVRKAICERNVPIDGIYPGNKGRKTTNPTAPMLLRAFRNLAIVYLDNPSQNIQMTSLTGTQKEILSLLGMDATYQKLLDNLKTGIDLRET